MTTWMLHDLVGSALVECLAAAGSAQDAARRATAFLLPLRSALDALA